MRAGEFADGAHVLRAKIDMASPNINMRDPVLYRIRRAHHHRTGDAWCIYPMYDFAHPLSDAHRGHHALALHARVRGSPAALRLAHRATCRCRRSPQQIEFARLNLTYTVMSKRKLLAAGRGRARRRAGTIRACRPSSACGGAATRRRRSATFCERIGVAKRENVVDVALLEHCVREDLNRRAPRVMARAAAAPGRDRELPRGPGRGARGRQQPGGCRRPGTRQVPFSRVLYIERDDFMEDPPKKFFRLAPGREVRLRYAYFITCTRRRQGRRRRGRRAALHLRSGDPRRRRARRPQGQGDAPLGVGRARARRRGAALRPAVQRPRTPDAATATIRARPESRARSKSLTGCKLEPSVADAPRRDPLPVRAARLLLRRSATRAPGAPVFNRTVTLKDTWARIAAAESR